MAGGGPENVLLVVNRNSTDSLTIANHYARLRQIPAGNVLTLPWDPKAQTTGIDEFRQQILIPVLTAIHKRRLAGQIDYVVYSSDFPWGIKLKPDDPKPLKPKRRWPEKFKSVGSITSLTYLWQAVLAHSPAYVQLRSNYYMRRPVPEQKDAPTLSFRSSQQFGPQGELFDNGGRSYLLSTMLGVTAGRGNSVDEVLSYLRRSAKADGTHPRGTIYYVKNNDIRSKTRHRGFLRAVMSLEELGVAAQIVEGKLPVGKSDVQGAMIGTAGFDWNSSGSTILPGAICEHLTSFGGVMRKGAGQTPLSELLRYGAAGASGTVVEPMAVAAKFPDPMIHVHYARGCTLAEAFYQSVYGPFQLLIVGDPLCRPWANIPQVKVQGVKPGATVKGVLILKPSATVPGGGKTVPGGGKVDHFELFIDGLRRAECRPGQSLQFDTTPLGDGYHELRVVAIETGPIQSQGRRIIDITTANHGRQINASVTPSGTVAADKPLVITARSPGSIGIVVLARSRLIGRIPGEEGRLEIDPATLGYGPVQLRVVALGNGGPITYVWAKPLELTVKTKGT